jgi:hypothetical protein
MDKPKTEEPPFLISRERMTRIQNRMVSQRRPNVVGPVEMTELETSTRRVKEAGGKRAAKLARRAERNYQPEE